MGRAHSTHGKEECIKDFGGKATRKETTNKQCRWEDIIKTDLRGIGWGGMNSIWLRIGTSEGFL
jgi:hypothetical protein